MYVAELLSVWTGAEVALVSANDREKFGALRGVHMTDGETMIAHYSAKEHLTYDDCAPFLANAFGLKGGVSSWQRVVIAYNMQATMCDDLRNLESKGLCFFQVSRSALHVLASVIVNEVSEDEEEAEETGKRIADAEELWLEEQEAEEKAKENAEETEAWSARFEELVAYYAEHGRAPVYKTGALGTWVVTQRTRRATMDAERKARLEALSCWSWDPQDEAWSVRSDEHASDEDESDHISPYGGARPPTP